MAAAHGVRRRPEGGLTVRLTGRERDVLAALPDQLDPVFRDGAGPEELRARIFPRAYEDEEAEREYQALVGDSLAEQHLDAMAVFTASLERGEVRRTTWTVDLDEDESHAWLSVVNDARLTLAGLLGIQEEADWERVPERGSAPSVVLWYLGWLEEQFVTALTTTLPD